MYLKKINFFLESVLVSLKITYMPVRLKRKLVKTPAVETILSRSTESKDIKSKNVIKNIAKDFEYD